jgi:hypothetical protein
MFKGEQMKKQYGQPHILSNISEGILPIAAAVAGLSALEALAAGAAAGLAGAAIASATKSTSSKRGGSVVEYQSKKLIPVFTES